MGMIHEFSKSEIEMLARMFVNANENDRRVRFDCEFRGFQIKVGEDMWTAPMGHIAESA